MSRVGLPASISLIFHRHAQRLVPKVILGPTGWQSVLTITYSKKQHKYHFLYGRQTL